MLEITEIRFKIRNQIRNQEIKVISRAWKSQKSGLKSVEIINQLEIKLILKSCTRFQQVLDPSGSTDTCELRPYFSAGRFNID